MSALFTKQTGNGFYAMNVFNVVKADMYLFHCELEQPNHDEFDSVLNVSLSEISFLCLEAEGFNFLSLLISHTDAVSTDNLFAQICSV